MPIEPADLQVRHPERRGRTDCTGLRSGQRWAYRASFTEPLAEVEIVLVGNKRPPRVKVAFVSDEFEGRLDWIPPGRLKAPWSEVDDFRELENHWNAVCEASRPTEAEEAAASIVLQVVLPEDVVTMGYTWTARVAAIHNVDLLAVALQVDPRALTSAPLAFRDGGALVVPWEVTLEITQRAAALEPARLLRHVETEERVESRRAVRGAYLGHGKHATYVSPETCAMTDAAHQETYQILRAWCGDASERRSEVLRFQEQARHATGVAQQAIRELDDAGLSGAARRLRRQLEELTGTNPADL